jgi:hypothetical protein
VGFEQPKTGIVAVPEINRVLLSETGGQPDCLVSHRRAELNVPRHLPNGETNGGLRLTRDYKVAILGYGAARYGLCHRIRSGRYEIAGLTHTILQSVHRSLLRAPRSIAPSPDCQ